MEAPTTDTEVGVGSEEDGEEDEVGLEATEVDSEVQTEVHPFFLLSLSPLCFRSTKQGPARVLSRQKAMLSTSEVLTQSFSLFSRFPLVRETVNLVS